MPHKGAGGYIYIYIYIYIYVCVCVCCKLVAAIYLYRASTAQVALHCAIIAVVQPVDSPVDSPPPLRLKSAVYVSPESLTCSQLCGWQTPAEFA